MAHGGGRAIAFCRCANGVATRRLRVCRSGGGREGAWGAGAEASPARVRCASDSSRRAVAHSHLLNLAVSHACRYHRYVALAGRPRASCGPCATPP